MPKKIYTEKDIGDLSESGVNSLQIKDDVILTDLAYETARRLGVQLIFDGVETPPSAPIRPYLSPAQSPHTAPSVGIAAASVVSPPAQPPKDGGLEKRIREAVASRLGSQVNARLLDAIIKRVLKNTGLK